MIHNIPVAGNCKYGNENSGSIKWGKLCLACLEELHPIVLVRLLLVKAEQSY